jgi:hypothetical protein
MITKEKLAAMPYAQAHIVRRPNAIVLVSYTTEVAEIRGGCLTVKGLYSATTRKHISAFCRQFGTDYQTAKKCYTDNLAYDIICREFVERV